MFKFEVKDKTTRFHVILSAILLGGVGYMLFIGFVFGAAMNGNTFNLSHTTTNGKIQAIFWFFMSTLLLYPIAFNVVGWIQIIRKASQKNVPLYAFLLIVVIFLFFAYPFFI